MKTQLLFVACLASMFFSAQTSITKAAHDPTVGDNVNNVVVTGTIDNSATGANTTFNNSSLTSGAAVTNSYSAPLAADLTAYPGTTIKHSDGNGTTIFYKQSATQLEITGIENPQATVKLTNNGTAMVYPTSFGSGTNTDQAQGSVIASGTTIYTKGPVTSTADAWGTLSIGNQTYSNVLRLKIYMNFTLYFDSTMFISIGSMQNTMYMYYDMTHKYPILTSTSLNATITGQAPMAFSGGQAQSFAFLATNDNTFSKSEVKFYPNPTSDIVNVTGNKNQMTEAVVYSADGKLLKSEKIQDGKVNVSELPSGSYILKVSDKKTDSKTVKIIKK